jgi:hypothetical protein
MPRITLTAAPRSVPKGKHSTLRGRVTLDGVALPGQTIVVTVRVPGTLERTPIATLVSAPDGRFHYVVRVMAVRAYRAGTTWGAKQVIAQEVSLHLRGRAIRFV